MKSYCQLGNIIFDVLSAPVSHEIEASHIFSELKPVLGLPVLHNKGEELEKHNLKFQFSQKFCDPEAMYQQLVSARINGEILPYVFASGAYLGDFVIESIKRSNDKTDLSGNVSLIEVEVVLKAVVNAELKIEKKASSKGNSYKKSPDGAGGKTKEEVSADEIVRNQ